MIRGQVGSDGKKDVLSGDEVGIALVPSPEKLLVFVARDVGLEEIILNGVNARGQRAASIPIWWLCVGVCMCVCV